MYRTVFVLVLLMVSLNSYECINDNGSKLIARVRRGMGYRSKCATVMKKVCKVFGHGKLKMRMCFMDSKTVCHALD